MGHKLVCGVYKITSKTHPERCYIGSSFYIYERWSGHKTTLEKGKHNPIMQAHYNKYGFDDFVFSILELCAKEDIRKREQFYIDNDPLQCYFNATKSAEDCTGLKQSPETIAKRVAKIKGTKRVFTPTHLENVIKAVKISVEKRRGKPSPKRGKKYGKNKKKPVYTEETWAIQTRKKSEKEKESFRRAWVVRKEEGKVGIRNEKGQFVKKSN